MRVNVSDVDLNIKKNLTGDLSRSNQKSIWRQKKVGDMSKKENPEGDSGVLRDQVGILWERN